MAYFHVIAKLKPLNKETCLFTDLTSDDLLAKFVVPYETGRSFLSGTNVIQSQDISSVQIFAKNRDSATEREAIQKRSWAEIEEINRNSDVLFISVGRGYDPEDIAEAGEDVTATYIKGPPGHKVHDHKPAATPNPKSDSVLKILLVTIAGGLVVAGIAKWLGWV